MNPIFPAFRALGANVLENQESRTWTCSGDYLKTDDATTPTPLWTLTSAAPFCEKLLQEYSFAVPAAGGESIDEIKETIRIENQNAVVAFLSHMEGIGYEGREHDTPWFQNNQIGSAKTDRSGPTILSSSTTVNSSGL